MVFLMTIAGSDMFSPAEERPRSRRHGENGKGTNPKLQRNQLQVEEKLKHRLIANIYTTSLFTPYIHLPSRPQSPSELRCELTSTSSRRFRWFLLEFHRRIVGHETAFTFLSISSSFFFNLAKKLSHFQNHVQRRLRFSEDNCKY